MTGTGDTEKGAAAEHGTYGLPIAGAPEQAHGAGSLGASQRTSVNTHKVTATTGFSIDRSQCVGAREAW